MARILIVDDSEHIRQLLKISLQLKQHDVTEAIDGRQALETLQGDEFDLVISDIEMPVMNGLQLLERIRDEIGDAAPPVLMLTAEMRETRERALALGAVEVLTKPFAPTQLFDEVEKHIRR